MERINTRKPLQIFTSLLALLFSVWVIFFMLQMDRGENIPFIAWVFQSSQPEIGLLAIALLVVSSFEMIVFIGDEVTILGARINPHSIYSKGAKYFFSVPIYILAIFSLASVITLMVLPPACSVPMISFSANTGGREVTYSPENVIDVGNAKSIIISAKINHPYYDCEMLAIGEIVDRFVPDNSSCSSMIYFNNKRGSMVVRTNIKKKGCNWSNYYNLTILKDQ